MMSKMSKSHIAVLISMLFAGPVAVVLAQSATTSEATESTQEQLQIAASEPVTPEAVVVTEVVVEQTTVVVAPVEPSVQAAAPAQPLRLRMWQVVKSDTFPQGSTDSADAGRHLPRLLAYLERLEQQRGSMIALGSSFPVGTNGEYDAYQPLPAQVAYFNRTEQQRVASVRPQEPIARSEVQARSGEESAQAGSAEVAMSSAR